MRLLRRDRSNEHDDGEHPHVVERITQLEEATDTMAQRLVRLEREAGIFKPHPRRATRSA